MARASTELRRRIGSTRQLTALDDALSGRANLVLVARPLGAGKGAAKRRADELLDSTGLDPVSRGELWRCSPGAAARRLPGGGLLGTVTAVLLTLIVDWGLSWVFLAVATMARKPETLQTVSFIAVLTLMFSAGRPARVGARAVHGQPGHLRDRRGHRRRRGARGEELRRSSF
ncbi:hypothetical protein [Amycolatopsis minnesotensis]|uniref:Uncharacterized protein n=1 Tax=Amycolatopsis minnesotensis TaxID=337894 RepID=A0ABP5DLR5_9PSEU